MTQLRTLFWRLILISLLPFTAAQGESTDDVRALVVTIPQQLHSNSAQSNYFHTLLQDALNHSKSDSEEIRVQQIDRYLSQGRMLRELNTGNSLDVVWTMTSVEREQNMLPIRIPLLKGLLGHRVFLIRADRQSTFSNIHHPDQLRQLMAGQGSHWPDTGVLQANGFPVMGTTKFEQLFTMLKNGRFDYFPRGLNEAWVELALHPHKQLAVETTLMLSYPAPMYFFVRNGNTAMAARIESGLNAMIDDGCFDKLFNSHPTTGKAIKRAQPHTRRVFRLENPALPEKTPLDVPHYWLNFNLD